MKEPKKVKRDKKKEYDEKAIQQTIFDLAKTETNDDTKPEIKETIDTWLDDKHIHSKTRLNGDQVIALTILKTISEKYGVTCIKELINNYVRYKLSEGGQSSKELVDILKNRPEVSEDMDLYKAIQPFVK